MKIKHEFVNRFPEPMENGILYVSIPFDVAGHLCFCGCGRQVITPINPTDWSLEYNGETVSLDPSIGSWNLPCQSHYFITENTIEWMPTWSKTRIKRGRKFDKYFKEKYFKKKRED
jgi:hypothetical protein